MGRAPRAGHRPVRASVEHRGAAGLVRASGAPLARVPISPYRRGVVTPRDEKAERLERWAEEQRLQAALFRIASDDEKLPQRIANRLLDRGLDTAGATFQPEQIAAGGNVYRPSAWNTLPRALRHVGVSPDDTFIDFGCGKGRIVHQAAKWPFRKVIGVEVAPALAEVARAAVEARRHQHRCKNVEIVVADARDYRVPDDLTIVYLFQPFQGETLDAVLRDIVGSIDRNPRRGSGIY